MLAYDSWLALPNGALFAVPVGVALLIDRLWGEPAARCHPVVWMGAYLGWVGRRVAPPVGDARLPPLTVFSRGVMAWLMGSSVVLGIALGAEFLLSGAPLWARALALGALLKPMLAWRMLRDEVQAVETALADSPNAGRSRLAWLVSRDVTQLSACEVRESAIETLAENLNDSVVAPLFWFAVAGLPGAAIYRFANTADAMWGYRGERQGRDWSWAGKWAARADDVLSWLPARITAVLLGLLSAPDILWKLPRQARITPSPNSGWPMAAMALALDVSLTKPGVYTLHPAGRQPMPGDTRRALQLAGRVVGALALLAGAVALVGMGRAFA
jgi:adenosylcobinamide-phosphate synthase